jgi:hypothetical protein
MWTGLTVDDASVEQGCVQVLSTRIPLQTHVHVVLPPKMFVAVLGEPRCLFRSVITCRLLIYM